MHSKNELIVGMLHWIDENIEKRLKIKDVARKSGYSSRYFQRLFLENTGKTIAAHVREKKIELAAMDLEDANNTICDIAIKYGYDSQQTFNRAFIRRFHITPGKWRKKLTINKP